MLRAQEALGSMGSTVGVSLQFQHFEKWRQEDQKSRDHPQLHSRFKASRGYRDFVFEGKERTLLAKEIDYKYNFSTTFPFLLKAGSLGVEFLWKSSFL